MHHHSSLPIAPPAYTGLALEPRSLPLRVEPRRLANRSQRLVERDSVRYVHEDFSIADASERSHVVAPALAKRTDLVEPTTFDHVPSPRLDDRAVFSTVHVEHDEDGPIGSSSVCALAQQKPV